MYLLTCTSDSFMEIFDNTSYATSVLADEARRVVTTSTKALRDAHSNVKLDMLLIGLLDMAPHLDGQRYVAVALHVAGNKGDDSVVNLAQAWFDNLIMPMKAISSNAAKIIPSDSMTPTIDKTFGKMESATRKDQGRLRSDVLKREQYYCAITKTFCSGRRDDLQEANQPIPTALLYLPMHAAHIILFLLNRFEEKTDVTREMREAAATWDMLKNWSSIDLDTLGPNINTSENAICMNMHEHTAFGRFDFYLDKDAGVVDMIPTFPMLTIILVP
ncbi:hypothetical protein VNI00_006237 [Paramarasmius palmivorus]|uniref:HNH nuclease domain-containing protein n=1 Tax=Paramarasmius palmivorus TaxID=297713 RepID=A0AAW0D8C5_9AGAR